MGAWEKEVRAPLFMSPVNVAILTQAFSANLEPAIVHDAGVYTWQEKAVTEHLTQVGHGAE